MIINEKVTSMIRDEALYIERNSEFHIDDITAAMRRAVEYYVNCGSLEEEAFDQARELVAMAVFSARSNGFELEGMVQQLIFSEFHRVQPGCGL